MREAEKKGRPRAGGAREAGWVSVALLTAFLVFQVAACLLARQMHFHLIQVLRQVRVDEADRAAELGWYWVKQKWAGEPNWVGWERLRVGTSEVDISVFEENGRLIVVSTGTLKDGIRRSLRVEADVRNRTPLAWKEGGAAATP